MEPKDFAASNRNLLPPKGMDNCTDLPVYTDGSVCISRWKASLKERLKILFTGNVWLWVYSGSHSQPPVSVEAEKPFWNKEWLEQHIKDKELLNR